MIKIKDLCLVLCFLLFVGSSFADTIYLKENAKGNQGKVIEEYPNYIVIKFPKSEIKRIESDEKPPLRQSPFLQKIIWVDDGDTITLRLPKQIVQITGDEELKAVVQSGALFPSTGFASNSLERLVEMSRSASDRVIQGKVFFKGDPLPNCRMRILRIADSEKDRLLNMLSGATEEEAEDSFEAVTDEHGIYTFTNTPYGEYILFWQPEGSESWIRRLSENPDITLIPGRPVAVRDIEANVRTVN